MIGPSTVLDLAVVDVLWKGLIVVVGLQTTVFHILLVAGNHYASENGEFGACNDLVAAALSLGKSIDM